MRISDWSSDVCSSDLPVEHLSHAQLRNRLAAHRLAHRAQRRGELFDRVIGGHILRLEMDFGDPPVIAGGEAIEDLGQPSARAPELGRASCRDSGCKYVRVSVGAGILIKKFIKK